MTTDSMRAPVAVAAPGRRHGRRIVTAQAAAFASQLFGSLQLVLLLHAGVSRATDAYFLIFGATQLMVSGWIVGVIYPRQLAQPGTDWAQIPRRAVVFSALVTGLATGYAIALGYPVGITISVAVPLLLSAAAAARATVDACRLACVGRATELAGVALPANVVACVALLTVGGHGSSTATTAMCAGLLLGNLGAASALRRRVASIVDVPPAVAPRRAPWLVVAAITAALSPLVMQAAVATFPSGDLSAFSVAYKFGLALTGIGLNSMLPLLLSWHRVEHDVLRRIVWCALTVALPAAYLAKLIATASGTTHYLSPAVVTAMTAWALICPATAIATRLTVITKDLRYFRFTAVANAALTIATVVTALCTHESVVVAAGLLVVEAAVTAILLHRVGKTASVVATLTVAVIAVCVAVTPLSVAALTATAGTAAVAVAGRRRSTAS